MSPFVQKRIYEHKKLKYWYNESIACWRVHEYHFWYIQYILARITDSTYNNQVISTLYDNFPIINQSKGFLANLSQSWNKQLNLQFIENVKIFFDDKLKKKLWQIEFSGWKGVLRQKLSMNRYGLIDNGYWLEKWNI